MSQPGAWTRIGLRRTRAPGSILIVVVWAIALLGFLAGSLGARGVWALELTSRMRHRLEASYAAVAAVEQALTALDEDPTSAWDGLNDEWASGKGRFDRRAFGHGWFLIGYPDASAPEGTVFGLIDEERLLNLNTAPIDVLARLLQLAAGLREDEATAIAESIQDWRDEDREAQPHGAESFYYLGLAEPYECKDGPFENVEELRLVRGVTAGTYELASPWLTVHGSGMVNLNTAGPEVLGALGLSQAGVRGLRRYRDGDDRLAGTADDRPLDSLDSLAAGLGSSLTNEDLGVLLLLIDKKLLTVKSSAFRMLASAGLEGSERDEALLRCVLTREGEIVAWEEH